VVFTSYTRWLECVKVKEGPEQEVYVTFSPRFERIWLESKKRLPDYMEQKPGNAGLRTQYALRLYGWAKKYAEDGAKTISLGELRRFLAWNQSRTRRGTSLRKRHCRSGRTSSNGRLMSRSGRSTRRPT
jgi:Initiator Replication protein